jgi:hypothetical protein
MALVADDGDAEPAVRAAGRCLGKPANQLGVQGAQAPGLPGPLGEPQLGGQQQRQVDQRGQCGQSRAGTSLAAARAACGPTIGPVAGIVAGIVAGSLVIRDSRRNIIWGGRLRRRTGHLGCRVRIVGRLSLAG